MTRVKGGPRARKKHKKVIKAAKGYRGTRRKLYKRAKEAYIRAGQHAYAGRRLRKRDMRTLWIQRINAALSQYDLTYSRFIKLLKDTGIELNRKMLAQLAVDDPEVFGKIVRKAEGKGKNKVSKERKSEGSAKSSP